MKSRYLAAILSIDVVGYSRMMQSDPDKLLAAVNAIFRGVVRPQVTKAQGRVFKLMGDGALIEFPSAQLALDCAVAIQKDLREGDPVYEFHEPVLLRLGLHAGDLVRENDDLFGEPINIAARLQSRAEPGGILLSQMLAQLAGGGSGIRLRREGVQTFKNIDQPLETLSVDMTDEQLDDERQKLALSQTIRFFQTRDKAHLAWTSVGSGPPVVKAPNWIGHLEHDWHNPGSRNLFTSLAGRHQLIRFDGRGNGLSDWDVAEFSFDLFVDDLARVFDAAKIDRAPIVGLSQGCPIAVGFAARYPERVSGLVLMGGFAVGRAKRKSKKEREQAKALQAMMEAGWDDDYPSLRDHMARLIVPGAAHEDLLRYAEVMREIISPANIARYRAALEEFDVRDLLPDIQVPALVMHAKGDRMQPIEQSRVLASGLPDARFIAFDSDNHIFVENDPCWPLVEREMLEFLAQLAGEPS
ncbi:alpha/beta fold hydrolase [Rhodovibrionaceae bacterium A322]